MMWMWSNGGWWMWVIGPLCMVVIVAVIAWAAVVVSRRPGVGSGSDRTGREPADVLRDRFARGEIDEGEYRCRLEILKGAAKAGDRP
jgi:putative membrane protein